MRRLTSLVALFGSLFFSPLPAVECEQLKADAAAAVAYASFAGDVERPKPREPAPVVPLTPAKVIPKAASPKAPTPVTKPKVTTPTMCGPKGCAPKRGRFRLFGR